MPKAVAPAPLPPMVPGTLPPVAPGEVRSARFLPLPPVIHERITVPRVVTTSPVVWPEPELVDPIEQDREVLFPNGSIFAVQLFTWDGDRRHPVPLGSGPWPVTLAGPPLTRVPVDVVLPGNGSLMPIHPTAGATLLRIFRLFVVLTADVLVDVQFDSVAVTPLSGRLRRLSNGTAITFDLATQPWFETSSDFGVRAWHTSTNPVYLAGASWAMPS